MPKLPICPDCGLEVSDKQPSKKVKGKTYHLSCYQQSIEKQYGTKVNQSDNTSDKEILYGYIKDIYGLAEVTAMIEKQIEKYCVDYKMTYIELKDVLYYYYNLCENPVNSEGIGIVPYILHEAKSHFEDVKRSNIENQKAIKEIKPLKETEAVVVHFKRRDSDSKNKIIDIENL